MFSDPLSVTYNSVSKSLVRLSSLARKNSKGGYGTRYATADGELTLVVAHTVNEYDNRCVEVRLTRTALSSAPITGQPGMVSNSFGITIEFDEFNQNASDVALLRTAVLALVDSTFTSKLTAGES